MTRILESIFATQYFIILGAKSLTILVIA